MCVCVDMHICVNEENGRRFFDDEGEKVCGGWEKKRAAAEGQARARGGARRGGRMSHETKCPKWHWTWTK